MNGVTTEARHYFKTLHRMYQTKKKLLALFSQVMFNLMGELRSICGVVLPPPSICSALILL